MEKLGSQRLNEQFYIEKSILLGKGNFGRVYKGYYLTENKIIAVKYMDNTMLENAPQYQRQLKIMQALTQYRHPNIMDYYGYVKRQDGLYCFIQYCAGGSLKQLIKKDGKVSQMKVLTLFKELLDAMTYINSLNKVHRDLKPDNLLFDENQDLKIADFGLARQVSIKMTKGACTPLYAAPQVMNSQPYDQKCDVWSAGLILYQMLMGQQYFKHVKTKSKLIQQLNSFSGFHDKVKYPKQLHPQWQRLTNKMLTHNPLLRPSFKQMLQKFKEAQQKMKSDIIQKYGYQTPGFQDFDDGMRLTKTISPYLSRPMKGKGIQQKFQQQRSYTNLINLRKFLTFYRLKSDIMIRLVKQFTNNPYGSLKNVYKYILMFLSLAAFMSKISYHLKQIKNKKISTPDGQLAHTDFTAQHLPQVQTLLDDFASKHQAALKKFQGVLQKQINYKITNTYMKRQDQLKIIKDLSTKYKDIQLLIQKSNKSQFQIQSEYMDIYRKIMNTPQVYIHNNILESLSQSDLKTYCFIRIIGNIDDIFLNAYYKQDDFLRLKKQDIQNKRKPQLITFIGQWNNN